MFGLDLGNLIAHVRVDWTEWNRSAAMARTKIKAMAATMEQAGRTMTRRVTTPIAAIAVAGTYSFAKFDDAMTNSLAIFGDVSEGMRQEMEKTATQLSLRSSKSAADLADAYFFLGSAGFNAAQSLKALSAVERFAVAGRFDLSTATTLAADAQKALGMTSSDAEQNLKNLTHVTDVLSGANTLANATIYQFSAALTNEAGPAMKVWNIALEEGVAVLAAYADQGIKAEEAGSSFGRMLRLTMKGFQENEKAWKGFGIDIYDTTTKNLRPMADIIEDLTGLLSDMSAKQKVVTLDMLGFQARSQQVILPLLGMADTIRTYNERLEEMSGLTEKLAERNLKSFWNQLKITWHHVEEFGRSVGRVLAPYIEKVGNGVRILSERWNNLDDAVKVSMVKWGLLLAAVGPVLVLFAKLMTTVGLLIIVMQSAGTAIVAVGAALSGVLLPLAAVAAAIAGIIAILYTMRAVWIQNVADIRTVIEALVDYWKQGFELIANSVVGKFVEWYLGVWRKMLTAAKEDFGYFVKDLSGLWSGLKALMKGEDFWTAYVGGFGAVNDALNNAKDAMVGLFEAGKLTIQKLDEFEALGKQAVLDAVKKQLGRDLHAALDAIREKLKAVNKDFAGMLQPDDVKAIKDRLNEITEGLKRFGVEGDKAWTDWAEHLEQAKDMTRNYQQVAIRAFDDTADALTELVTTGTTDIRALAQAILTDLLRAIIRARMAAAWETWLQPGGSSMLGAIGAGVSGAVGGVRGLLSGAGGYASGVSATATPGAGRFALGAAISAGHVIPMQAGAIIGAATFAPMANRKTALMGEAGPEGVFPLMRDKSGKLGVRAEQPRVNVDSRTKIVNVFDREAMLAAVQSDQGEKVVLNVLRKRGII